MKFFFGFFGGASKRKIKGPKFCLFNTLINVEVVLTLICNCTFTFLKYPMMRGPDLAAAPYSTQKSSVLPLCEVSSYLSLCVSYKIMCMI